MTTKSQKLCHLMIDPSQILIEMSTVSGLDPVKVPANRKDAHSQVLSNFAESDLWGRVMFQTFRTKRKVCYAA